ncbi:hypothetical protein DU002_14630 [Corallincola holothuriorum]|uniref:Uncharacterized protein n=1 Tax=Corallincola holothuriorum TaxID=2282215 RepID=A0A368N564_9GAMM|nr:hypothetical protein [Corallincola holothuriorum]RCU45692.1 hypothetical protein DU002_14630 [Corallincola holothuriorum]
MRFTVLTHKGPYNFSSDYINHMYPVDSLYKACKQIEKEPKFSDISDTPVKPTSLAGPLEKLPNDLNGAKRKQSLLSELDRTLNIRNARAADRLHWKGLSSIPRSATRALAPIQPSTSLYRRTTTTAGLAMAVGVISQKGRAMILYDLVKGNARAIAQKAKHKHPESKGCVVSINIQYLKVRRDFGRAPTLYSLTVDKVLDVMSVVDLSATQYVGEKISKICNPQLSPIPELSIKVHPDSQVEHNKYGYAILYLKCEW